MAGGQPPVEAVRPPKVTVDMIEGKRSYGDVLHLQMSKQVPVPMKQITYLHGEPIVIWEEEEISQMIANEQLEYAVIGKFSYGWPEIQVLRRLIPQ